MPPANLGPSGEVVPQQLKKRGRGCLIAAGVLAFVACPCVVWDLSKLFREQTVAPLATPNPSTSQPSSIVDAGQPQSDATTASEAFLVVAASKLADDVGDNEIAAEQRYMGKRFVVFGKMASVERMALTGDVVLTLQEAGALRHGRLGLGVRATLTEGQEEGVARLSPGSDVTLICRGDAFRMGHVMLRDCTLEPPRFWCWSYPRHPEPAAARSTGSGILAEDAELGSYADVIGSACQPTAEQCGLDVAPRHGSCVPASEASCVHLQGGRRAATLCVSTPDPRGCEGLNLLTQAFARHKVRQFRGMTAGACARLSRSQAERFYATDTIH